MAASPLFGAAISNPGLIGGNGGVFQDPTYWPVQRRMSLAQAMMGEGLSGAPAYPMQALARVVQAGLGAWMEDKAEKQLQDTISKQGADAVAAYQGALAMGPLGSALMTQPGSTAAPLPPAPQAPPAPSYGGGGPGASVEMPPEYQQFYAEASKRTGIPVEVLQAKDRQESGFNPGATGAAGEIGIGQISPKTAVSPGFGMAGVQNPDVLRDPRTNIDFGADYLKARAGNVDWHDPAQVAAALKTYNGGGDPNYAANVMRYLPQTYAMAAGQAQPAQAPPTAQGGATPTPEQMHAMSDQDWLAQQNKTYPGMVRPWDVAAGGNTASDTRPAVPMPSAAAGGGAPAPQQGAQGGAAPPQGAAAPSAAVQPQGGTGAQSPNIQQAIRMMQTAAEMRLQNPYSRPHQILAQSLEQQAQLLMTLDTFKTVQTPNGPMTINQRTGEPKYLLPETPRPVTDQQGNTWILHPGGQATLLQGNPSGIAGNEPENVQLRTLTDLGAKLNSGQPLTPQELTKLLTTATAWQQFRADRDPNTGRIEMHPTRPLPPGLEALGSILHGTGQMPGASGVTSLSQGMSPAQRGAEEKLGQDFATVDKKAYDNANASLGMLTSMNNSAEVLNSTPGGWAATGAGANARLEIGKSLNQVAGLFGGQPVVDPEKVGSWELLNKQTKLMGMQVINAYFGGSREAASIINGATNAVPNAENSYLGFRMVSSGIEQDLQRQRELYQFKADRLANGQPLATAETDFNKAHPIKDYTLRAIANAVPDDLTDYLKAHPETVGAFNKHFGAGIGEFILKGSRTGLGSAASAGASGG